MNTIEQAQTTKMESVRRKYTDLRKEHNQSNQEKVALIKEVKRLRQIVQEHKVENDKLLEQIKSDEIQHRQNEESLKLEIESLSKQHTQITERFKQIIRLLTGKIGIRASAVCSLGKLRRNCSDFVHLRGDALIPIFMEQIVIRALRALVIRSLTSQSMDYWKAMIQNMKREGNRPSCWMKR